MRWSPLVLMTAAACAGSSPAAPPATAGAGPSAVDAAVAPPPAPGSPAPAPGAPAPTPGSPPAEVADAALAVDGATLPLDAAAPPKGDGGVPNYEGAIPPYEGPPVGPEVKMDCPGDPTAGFTEYKDTFHVEHPYDLPAAARFSIDDGVYTFWIMHGDKKHSPTSTAPNPRTEARYAQTFKSGIRLWSADVYWEKAVSKGTVVMQVHTTATGIGPVYMVASGNDVMPISGDKVPGGLYDRWINLKVLINADTTASQYWVNNCLVASRASGTRGDGNDYFKMGVYHCDTGVCRDRYKNVHLYIKP